MAGAASSDGEGLRPERLFFALWPDVALQAQLHGLARERREAVRRQGRLVPAENLHLTLVFLGAVEAGQRVCLEEAAAGVSVPPFTLVLDEFDCLQRRGLFWAGASHTPPALADLVQQLNAAAARCGSATDAASRPFKPHVTLARRLPRCPRAGPLAPPLAWTVSHFCLVRSDTRPKGAHYEILRVWALKATGE
jgi:2'-5' RNA ligase